MRMTKIFLTFYTLSFIFFAVSAVLLFFRLQEQSAFETFYQEMFDSSEEEVTSPSNKEGEASPTLFSRRVAQMPEHYADMVAWLQIADTTIDYPVMLGEDNQFYLNYLPNGEKNSLGSLFLDYRTTEDSLNLIIYGHNGARGKLFGALKEYESSNYLKTHPSFTFSTEDSQYTCQIFSVRRITTKDETYSLALDSQEALLDYVQRAGQQSLYPIAVDSSGACRIITLSTCTEKDEQRLVVQAIIEE